MKFSYILTTVGLGASAAMYTVGPMSKLDAKALSVLQSAYRFGGMVYIPLVDLKVCHPPRKELVLELLPESFVKAKAIALKKMSEVELTQTFTGDAAPYNVIRTVDPKYLILPKGRSMEDMSPLELDDSLRRGIEHQLLGCVLFPGLGAMGAAALSLFRRYERPVTSTVYWAIEKRGIDATTEIFELIRTLEPIFRHPKHEVVVRTIVSALPKTDGVRNPTVDEVLKKYPKRNKMCFADCFNAITQMITAV